MIPFDFEYYKPTTITEATDLYDSLKKRNKRIVYYSGGTEFITFARTNRIVCDAVIDIKGIPECKLIEVQDDKIIIGSAVTLNEIFESNVFPMLGENVKQIADHTSRNKITLGGNLNSHMIYRESLLPLLIAEGEISIARGNQEENLPVNKEMKLKDGDLLVRVIINKEYAHAPFKVIKKTKSTKVGYPIVSSAALVKEKMIRIAFSGVCAYPFRSIDIEKTLNVSTLSIEERVNKAISLLPGEVMDDILGSSNYRKFVLKDTLLETMKALEEHVI